MTQFSLFGAEAASPTLADLDGVLLAGGHWVRSGAGARLSVVVRDRWRADALAEEFYLRGVSCSAAEAAIIPAEQGLTVRTGFSTDLLGPAHSWTRGANQGPPAGFGLTGTGLRLWCIAAGRAAGSESGAGFLLETTDPQDVIHTAAGAQLSRLGVPAVSIAHARLADGITGWRVSSAKRLRRLLEIVGPAPIGAGTDWPPGR
jgi:hypothetical protein